MSAFTAEERIALLFSVLGNEVADAAVRAMNPTRGNYIKRLLKDYQANPASDEEKEYVIDHFLKYFQFAIQSILPEIEAANAKSEDEIAEDEKREKERVANGHQITYFPKLVPSDDPIADLNQLDPYQILMAMESDHPKTLAMVLSRLDPTIAASVLTGLSDETRTATVVFLSQESTIPTLIVEKVLRSTLANAMKIEFRENTIDQTQILADLMRSIPKNLRSELIEKLEEANPEFCESVKEKLYVFEDLCRLNDRDVQKLLGEIQTDFLIIGLQKASPEVTEKLIGNLSKRARQSVEEEMHYKTNVSQQEIDEARAQLTAVLAKLDEAGEVSLT